MGKSGAIGRALLKNSGRKKATFSDRHTTTNHEDFSRLPVRSVTEETSLNEFFSIAELANSDFSAQKKTFRFLDKYEVTGVVSEGTGQHTSEMQESLKGLLKIPRRPKWTKTMTNEELHALEKEELLNWRRGLARLEQTKGILLTPYEKNLEFWRQLWRVVERSDLLVQIVDARQPLLYYCSDLEAYAREVDPNKRCMVLVNKSDFLTEEQRQTWADYFQSAGIHALFWSATMASDPTGYSRGELSTSKHMDPVEESTREEEAERKEVNGDVDSAGDDKDDPDVDYQSDSTDTDGESSTEADYSTAHETDSTEQGEDQVTDPVRPTGKNESPAKSEQRSADEKLAPKHTSLDSYPSSMDSTSSERTAVNFARIVTATELLHLFVTNIYPSEEPRLRRSQLTVGFIGYPNVGKSSTLNALMGSKKTSVSATPGKTKHFQTLLVQPDLILCDCPGLVMPSFVHSKADLVVAGILSIDEMRDCLSPIGLVCARIPRMVLEFKYGIDLSKPKLDCTVNHESETEDQPPTPHELLAAHAFMHGFMTAKGNPNYDRSARLILKDYVQGALLYCHPPPGTESKSFQFMGRSENGLPPSLANADASKLAKFHQMKQKQRHTAAAKTTDPINATSLISEFDRIAFEKTSRHRPHVRSRKHLLRPDPAGLIADQDPDAFETASVASSASWATTDTVGGSSLLSGTESMRSNWTGTTATGLGAGHKKPWRLMSDSKRLVTVRSDPFPLETGAPCGISRKRREKLRRVYASLDQHEKS
ncbi:Large subunit GTPase 1 [Fasciola hepatica]|uniref:Large subunit GTPase 1 homolog n=1 Tax=Fasciola hepatica TaxID=6192 RepID=A0A4E0RES9_FASHE|nr:Large subunit GTPase 1 [Fasciola hepatica]